MRRLAHLSDLHYGADPETQSKLLEGLIETFSGRDIDVLLFTGDVFDTNEARPKLIEGFLRLHAGLEAKLGGPRPTVILPGNHDRRSEGVFRPYSEVLFDELRRAFASRPDVQVMGGHTPFLAQHVRLPDFPFDVVAYDSTWLPNGVASAGGVIRQEDLIQVGSELMNGDATRPVLFLLHHHLIPTPVKDTSAISTAGRHVTSQAWSPWNPTRRSTPRRLVRARREGTRWVLSDAMPPRPFSPVLKLNASKVVLETYREVVTGPGGAMLRDAVMGGVARRDAKCPAKIKVPRDGTTRFRVEGGAYRTVTDSDGRAFASVELLNRSRAELARLEVHLGPVTTKPFASVTNLTTGKERPWRFEHVGDVVTVTFPQCPARTMLRVSWPLET